MSILVLLFLHHLADVALQPSWLIENKKKHAFAIYEHVAIYTGVICLGFYAIGKFEPWLVPWFFLGHFATDYAKYRLVPHRNDYRWIYPDQALHYLQIIIPLIHI